MDKTQFMLEFHLLKLNLDPEPTLQKIKLKDDIEKIIKFISSVRNEMRKRKIAETL